MSKNIIFIYSIFFISFLFVTLMQGEQKFAENISLSEIYNYTDKKGYLQVTNKNIYKCIKTF